MAQRRGDVLVTVTLTTGEAEAVLHALDLLANVRLMAKASLALAAGLVMADVGTQRGDQHE